MTRAQTAQWLTVLGLPVLPVAPTFPASEYPAKDKDGKIKIDKDGNPIPAFTGKNPSYLDRNGKPRLINHRKYQNQMPSNSEMKDWFHSEAVGIGTLGGIKNIYWIDIDRKQFESQEECDRAFWAVAAKIGDPHLWQAQTQSGGYRIAVKLAIAPDFTNFALTAGGSHVGEVLGAGRFTVLPPTVGESGNYTLLNDGEPIVVESLEAIGIYPRKTVGGADGQTVLRQSVATPGSIPLDMLGNEESRTILNGSDTKGDRSESLTTAIREWFGWERWASQNGLTVRDSTEQLAEYAGRALGVDSDRVSRILKTINPDECQPACLIKGDETSAWKKIRRLDKASFDSKCPEFIKRSIGGGSGFDRPIKEAVLASASTPRDVPATDSVYTSSPHGSSGRDVGNTKTPSYDLEIEECKNEVRDIEKRSRDRLDIKALLHPKLANAILAAADAMPTAPESFFTTLMSTAASQIGRSAKIELGDGWDQPAVFSSMIVEASGKLKTPPQKVVIAPIERQQWEAQTRHESVMADYEARKKAAAREQEDFSEPEPAIEEYWLSDTTIEAIGKTHQENPRGFLVYIDEIDAFYGGLNKYHGGAGDDEQKWLSLLEGGSIKVNRLSRKLYVPQTAISVTGTIQTETILMHLRNKKRGSSGMNARWNYCAVPLPSPYFDPKHQGSTAVMDLQRMVSGLYKKLRAITGDIDLDAFGGFKPRMYGLTPEAQNYWNYEWRNPQVARYDRESNGDMQLVLAKQRGYAGRNALILHLINYCMALPDYEEGQVIEPPKWLNTNAVKRGCSVGEFFIGQAYKLYGVSGVESEDKNETEWTPLMLKLKEASIAASEDYDGWITPRMARRKTRLVKSGDHAKSVFAQLYESGFGELDTSGDIPKWRWVEPVTEVITENSVDAVDAEPESLITQDFECVYIYVAPSVVSDDAVDADCHPVVSHPTPATAHSNSGHSSSNGKGFSANGNGHRNGSAPPSELTSSDPYGF